MSHPGSVFPDEVELVARLRAGEGAACALLVEWHESRMLACARRLLHSEEECAEAVHEAFVSAWRARESFAGTAQLSTWLHRIVMNQCLMRLRGRRRRRTVPLDQHLPAFDESRQPIRAIGRAEGDRPEEALSRQEMRLRVRECIDQLPPSYREIVRLRDLEGLDTDQAARLLGTTTGVVKTRLHRARQALRALLAPLVEAQG
jgi:RNA polymerase sigma-70 factor (ECF subfamily)